MPKLKTRFPAYRLHRASGQGIVTLNGQDHYLGPHGNPRGRQEYDRLIHEWLVGGRQAPITPAEELSINELIVRFWSFAEHYYRQADGRVSREIEMYRQPQSGTYPYRQWPFRGA